MYAPTAPEVKNPTAAQVCLVLGLALILAGSVVTLAAMNKDVGAIFTAVAAVVLLVAGAFGWTKASQIQRDVDHVKEISNGRVTQLLDDLANANQKLTALAMLVQPPKETPPELEVK